MQQGVQKGEHKREEELIIEMHKRNLDIPLIGDITRQPTERILEIKRQYKIQ